MGRTGELPCDDLHRDEVLLRDCDLRLEVLFLRKVDFPPLGEVRRSGDRDLEVRGPCGDLPRPLTEGGFFLSIGLAPSGDEDLLGE